MIYSYKPNRPAVCAVTFFTMGILSLFSGIYVPAIAALLVSLGLFCLFYGKNFIPILTVAALVFTAGFVYAHFISERRMSQAAFYDGLYLETDAVVTDFSSNGSFTAEAEYKGEKLKFSAYYGDACELLPGEKVKLCVTFSALSRTNGNFFDYASSQNGNGIFLSGYCDSLTKTGKYEKGVRGLIYAVRRFADRQGKKHFSGDIRALFNAMVLGDRHLLSSELSDALRKSGLSHIAVVSGMHLSVMIAVIMLLIGKLAGNIRYLRILPIAAAVSLTFITGCGASVVRACIMCVMYQLSQMLFRDTDSLTSLFCAAGIMLIFNPFTIFNIGFILSFLSVLGIILFYGKIKLITDKFAPSAASESLAVSISAQLTVTPLSMYFFSQITPYAPVSNLLIFIFASALVTAGLIFLIVCKITFAASLGAIVVKALSVTVISVCGIFSRLPFAVIESNGIPLAFLSLWIIFLAAVLCFPLTQKSAKHLCTVTLSALSLCLFASLLYKSSIIITDISSGTLQCTAFVFPDGHTLVSGYGDISGLRSFADRYSGGKISFYVLSGCDKREIIETAESKIADTLIIPDKKYGASVNSVLSGISETNIIRIDTDEKSVLFGKTSVTISENSIKTDCDEFSFLDMSSSTENYSDCVYEAACRRCTFFRPPKMFSDVSKSHFPECGGTVIHKNDIYRIKSSDI